MSVPGYYKTNYRALRFRELVRFRGLRRAFAYYIVTRFKRPDGGSWMPSLWADIECKREDLSEKFWQATQAHRANFDRLGYVECGFQKLTKSLHPMLRDSGGIKYLDPSRCYFGQLIYNRFRVPTGGAEVVRTVIAFTAAFKENNLSCTNHTKAFDPPSENEVIRVSSNDVNFIHERFLNHLHTRQEAPRSFSDLESFRKWYDARQILAFEERTRRRLYIPMTDQEVVAAKTRKAQADALTIPPPLRAFRLPLIPMIVVVALGVYFIYNQFGQKRDDSIEYRGERFKMRKPYSSYEDYKDDADNLDTNELDRIERVMTSAPVPFSFKDREAFTHTLIFDLTFPGYGAGGVGPTQTDDGSLLEAQSVEIPQRDKDRYIVVRMSGGQWNLVDDFVRETLTNTIGRIKLENQTLRYFDNKGNIIREKHL